MRFFCYACAGILFALLCCFVFWISKHGIVYIRGNGSGQGYDWTQGVEGLYGSYLTFVARPSHPPSPVVLPEPVVHDTRLAAYWDSGACGPHGNDHN